MTLVIWDELEGSLEVWDLVARAAHLERAFDELSSQEVVCFSMIRAACCWESSIV